MRVLLVQAYLDRNRIESHMELVYPIGLAYLATALKEHEVSIFDPNTVEDPLASLKEKIAQDPPHILGISMRYLEGRHGVLILEWCKDLIEFVRNQVSHEVRVIAGGPAFSLYALGVMKFVPEIDFGIFGEGENILPELLRNLENPEEVKGVFYRKGKDILFTGKNQRPNFDVFPEPRRDLLDMNPYLSEADAIGIQTKRGCALKCIYCSYPFLSGSKLRLRPPKEVVDEIENLVNNYGMEAFTFADNVFNIPLNHAEEICQEIIKRRIHVDWSAWFSEHYMNEEFVQLIKEAGCKKIELSPDGFSNRTLRQLGKDIRNKDIMRTYQILKKVGGVDVLYNFFIWPPGQNLIGLLKMVWFRIQAKHTLKHRLKQIGFVPIRIVPNSKLHDTAIKEGIIREDTDLLFSPALYWGSGARWIVSLIKAGFKLRLMKNKFRMKMVKRPSS